MTRASSSLRRRRSLTHTEPVRAAAASSGRQEQALAASAAKSRFLATVSHEIRTPLHGLLGFAELLRESQLLSEQVRVHATLAALSTPSHPLEKRKSGRAYTLFGGAAAERRPGGAHRCHRGMLSPQQSYVEVIRSTGRTVMEIINSILELSRIEAGTVVHAPVPFTVDGCVTDALDLVFGRAAYDRGAASTRGRTRG